MIHLIHPLELNVSAQALVLISGTKGRIVKKVKQLL